MVDQKIKISKEEIHKLLQESKYLYDLIAKYTAEVDDHLEDCKDCCEKVVGLAEHIPRLRKRMIVDFPDPNSYHERLNQLKQLKRGQCLPCGCEVLSPAWTRDDAITAFYKSLAEIMQTPEKEAKKITGEFKLQDLPLNIISLRRLRDKFWIPDGSHGSAEKRDLEEGNHVLQLPETINEFIDKILNIRSGVCLVACYHHWP